MATDTAEERANVEGANLLGQPNFTELENGRCRCVETGHEVLAEDMDSYSRSKRCRFALIDFALSQRESPLNMFEQDPLFCSKLKCKLTGRTINKTEEHIWKHINGRRFLKKLEKKELEKRKLSKSGEQQGKKKAGKASKPSTENSKDKKKKRKANFLMPPAALHQVCDNGEGDKAIATVAEQEELEKDTLNKSGEQKGKKKASEASNPSTENSKDKRKKKKPNFLMLPAGQGLDSDNGESDQAIVAAWKMNPGPTNPIILYLQPTHRSELLWNDQSTNCLQCRRREAILHRSINLDPRIVPYLKQSGFWGVTQIGFTQLDWHLITALVERWRPETHTFHMPGGECTITLQDVAVQFGLPIDGEPVTGSLQHDWPAVCEDLLGIRPPQLKGSRLSLPWLATHFKELPPDADDVMVKRYTRAYIMQLIGGFLFADKSNTLVHLMFLPLLNDFEEAGRYSWGSACLAWLYRELCRASHMDALEIAGPLILLQVWAWDRFPTIAPQRQLMTSNEYVGCPLSARWSGSLTVTKVSTHVLSQYRYTFDRLSLNQIVWTPYTPEIMSMLPDYCHNGQDIWLTISPLICFHIVEWHRPDRVLRQFRFRQCVPPYCNTDTQLHQLDLRGKYDTDWRRQHEKYISAWGLRRDHCVSGEVMLDRSDVSNDYFSWYNSITRRYITREGTSHDYMANIMKEIYDFSLQNGIDKIKSLCEGCFEVMDDLHRRSTVPPPTNDLNKQRSHRKRQQPPVDDTLDPKVED